MFIKLFLEVFMMFKRSEIKSKLEAFDLIINSEKRFPAFFDYFAMKNRKVFSTEFDFIVETEKKQLKEYFEEKMKLIDIYAEKDENNKPIVVDDKYQIKNVKEFLEANNENEKKYASVLEEFQTFINEEVKLDIFQIKFSKIENFELPKGLVAELFEFFVED
jgi:hypothetical protein